MRNLTFYQIGIKKLFDIWLHLGPMMHFHFRPPWRRHGRDPALELPRKNQLTMDLSSWSQKRTPEMMQMGIPVCCSLYSLV